MILSLLSSVVLLSLPCSSFSFCFLSFLDSALWSLFFCQPFPPCTFYSFQRFAPLPVSISFSPLSLIKTVPQSSPRREEEDKNSSSSACAHWFCLSSLRSIHQITTFLHNNHCFFFLSLCSSLTLSLFPSLRGPSPNHPQICLFKVSLQLCVSSSNGVVETPKEAVIMKLHAIRHRCDGERAALLLIQLMCVLRIGSAWCENVNFFAS